MEDSAYRPRRGLLGSGSGKLRRLWVIPVLIAVAALLMSSFARVLPGNVGIRVNNIAGGVSPTSLGVGWYFAPPGTHIYEYPVFTRTYTWTANSTEERQVNESFSFQDKNGLALSADVAVSYHVDPVRASILFQRYRTDMDLIIAGRCATRSATPSSSGPRSWRRGDLWAAQERADRHGPEARAGLLRAGRAAGRAALLGGQYRGARAGAAADQRQDRQ